MRIVVILVLALVFIPEFATAQRINQCEVALRPTIERDESDRRSVLGYVGLHAEAEYERVARLSEEARGLDLSYKAFQMEFDESDNSREFRERVHQRLDYVGLSTNETELLAAYRSYLSQEQLNAWASCAQSVSRAGAVLLSGQPSDEGPFSLIVNWVQPGRLRDSTVVTISLAGGTIDGERQVSFSADTDHDMSYIVTPDSDVSRVVVAANAGGFTDAITLLTEYPALRFEDLTPPEPEPDTIVVLAHEFRAGEYVGLGDAYGFPNVLMNVPPTVPHANAAEFSLSALAAGQYDLWAEYAAAEPRPVDIFINGRLVMRGALNAPTGGWTAEHQQLLNQVTVTLREGENVLRFQRVNVIPHIRRFVFIPVAR